MIDDVTVWVTATEIVACKAEASWPCHGVSVIGIDSSVAIEYGDPQEVRGPFLARVQNGALAEITKITDPASTPACAPAPRRPIERALPTESGSVPLIPPATADPNAEIIPPGTCAQMQPAG